jgi:hypothetical protein
MKRWPYLLILAVLIAGVAASSIRNVPRIAEARMPMVVMSGSTPVAEESSTGWTILTNPTELTGWTTDTAWTTADLTSSTSADARMAIIRCTRVDTGYGAFSYGVQPYNSTSDHYQDIEHAHHYVVVQLDSEQRLEYYQEDNTEQNFYLVGYSEADTMKTDPIDYSISAISAWTDADVTSDTAVGATAAFFEIRGAPAAGYYGFLREDGITAAPWDAVTYSKIENDEHFFAGVGLSTGEVCELYITHADVDHFLWGYANSTEMVWLDSPTDISLSDNFESWQDVDLTSYIPSGDPVGAIIMIVNNAGNEFGKVRENGSIDDLTSPECYLTENTNIIAYVGMDGDDIVEIYEGDDTVDHYIIGFIY